MLLIFRRNYQKIIEICTVIQFRKRLKSSASKDTSIGRRGQIGAQRKKPQDTTAESGVGQREERQKDETRDESPMDELPENCIPTSIVETRAGGLSTICSRTARESRSAASCAHTGGSRIGIRQRDSRASSLADRHPRAPVFQIARVWSPDCSSKSDSGKADIWIWIVQRLRLASPRRRTRASTGFQSRNRPASPSQPAGANSRVTPVLAANHSRAPARTDRTCSPSTARVSVKQYRVTRVETLWILKNLFSLERYTGESREFLSEAESGLKVVRKL